MNVSTLAVFVPTFFFVSLTPGLCMTLALTMGMTMGVRRTLWMMVGELLGVALVGVAAVIGVAAVMLQYPLLFTLIKFAGGVYLCYLGVQMWLSKGKMAFSAERSEQSTQPGLALAGQGFMTAVTNPKGWAFFVSLLPPFINPHQSMAPQIVMLLSIILLLEFSCLMLYATGGVG